MKLGLGIGLNRGRRGGGAPGAVGILDSYTGAAFAFAPDTLIYSGFSVTDNTAGSNTNGSSGEFTVLVRRDSDNALQSFTWEEVSDGTLVTWVGAGNNGFVQVAYDQSGNDNHASQTTAANQPRIVDNGSLVVENGKAALDFDGANDFLQCVQNNPFTFTGAISILSVANKNNTPYKVYETIFSSGTSGVSTVNSEKSMAFLVSSGVGVAGAPAIATDIWQPSGISSNLTQITPKTLFNEFYIPNWSIHKQLSGVTAYSNGELLTLSSYSSNQPLELNNNPIKIGCFDTILTTSFWAGAIQIIVAYPSNQSGNQTGLSTAINTEYNIY